MKMLADENIPFVDLYFGDQIDVTFKPGRDIGKKDLLDIDLLLVRSVTQVNQDLLEGTSVRWVGSVTTGTDHIDSEWLNGVGIQWCAAKGYNTAAVEQYVICILAGLQKKGFLRHKKCRAGVIGVGRIGSRVVEKLKLLNFEVLACDPFRHGNDFISTNLNDFEDLDFITVHTPLTRHGLHPTFHMIDKNFLQRQKKSCILLNTSRGSVIHFSDLKNHGDHMVWCFDVWEHEPLIDVDVLNKAFIATPHIAGYSAQGQWHGIEMIHQQMVNQGILTPSSRNLVNTLPHQIISFDNKKADWRDVVLRIYNPFETTAMMKKTLADDPLQFDFLRKHFPKPHEFEFVKIEDAALGNEDKEVLTALKIKIF